MVKAAATGRMTAETVLIGRNADAGRLRFVRRVGTIGNVNELSITQSSGVHETGDERVSAADLPRLYDLHAERTLAFLVSLGLRGSDAEDVHHDAWMKVVKKLGDETIEGNVRGWLFKVMRNMAYDHLRRRRPTPMADAALDDAAPPAVVPPDRRMLDGEYHDALTACLAKLDSASQELIRGRLGGASYNELASRLEIEVARAHRLFFGAKRSLTACVQQRMGAAR